MSKRLNYEEDASEVRLKVTIELPRALVKQIKLFAIEDECSMRDLVERAKCEFLVLRGRVEAKAIRSRKG